MNNSTKLECYADDEKYELAIADLKKEYGQCYVDVISFDFNMTVIEFLETFYDCKKECFTI